GRWSPARFAPTCAEAEQRVERPVGHGAPPGLRQWSNVAMTRLGYQIPNFTYPDVGPAGLFDAIARQAKEADESGFDTFLVMDHFYLLPGLCTPDHYMLGFYTQLAALARETSRVRLSAIVTGNT